MGKKSKRKASAVSTQKVEVKAEFSDAVEYRFKSILKIMSWIVGICFILIIILPNFEFIMVDILVKFFFYLGVFNLLLFAALEMFANSVKKLLSKSLENS